MKYKKGQKLISKQGFCLECAKGEICIITRLPNKKAKYIGHEYYEVTFYERIEHRKEHPNTPVFMSGSYPSEKYYYDEWILDLHFKIIDVIFNCVQVLFSFKKRNKKNSPRPSDI